MDLSVDPNAQLPMYLQLIQKLQDPSLSQADKSDASTGLFNQQAAMMPQLPQNSNIFQKASQ